MKKYQIDGITENNVKQFVKWNLFNPIYAIDEEEAKVFFEKRLEHFYKLFNLYDIKASHDIIKYWNSDINGSD